MQNPNNTGFFSFRADANAVGGFLEKPLRKPLPTLAPVSLPAVGGFALARSEGFTLDNLISCKSAFSRVSGEENEDGTVSIQVASVVEGLNLLEVVEAERVVAQLSILISKDRKILKLSTAGSRFERLVVAGDHRVPLLQNSQMVCDTSNLPEGQTAENAWVSLVGGFGKKAEAGGHIVDIPEFGRFVFGELLLTPTSVQMISIRAELGCPVKGRITINCTGGGGVGDY
jgi:hypothetical protein